MTPNPKKIRKDLAADSLYKQIHTQFDQIPDPRTGQTTITLGDSLMAAFAMFTLKDPSLLAFDQRRENPHDNFRTVFKIAHVPCDSQMRAILDPVDPTHLRPLFTDVFRRLQRGKVLEEFVYYEGHYLLSLDGTGYFSSSEIHCDSCLEKHHRNGTITYSHQMLGAVLVHPDHKEVIPLMPEPIIKADGDLKNDCERNATRRWLKQFRREHPHLPVIIIEDGLAANAPHLADLKEATAEYIISVKQGDHKYLFRNIYEADAAGRTQTLTERDEATGVLHHFRFHNGLALNESNPDCLVNVLEYWEIHPDRVVKKKVRKGTVQQFSWIVAFELSTATVSIMMRGGRSRWKVENETFNTLKNQGYHLEHNYGHGEQNLSVVLAVMMMLVFLVDQVQQACCPLFQAAWEKMRQKCALWARLRNLYEIFVFRSMAALLEAIVYGIVPREPELSDSS